MSSDLTKQTALRSTHHAVRVGVTGLGHRQALNDLRSHPGEGAHHGHVGGVGEELRGPEITNLKFQQRGREDLGQMGIRAETE